MTKFVVLQALYAKRNKIILKTRVSTEKNKQRTINGLKNIFFFLALK